MFNTMDNTMDTNLYNGCLHRLPCGYCVLLGRDCPRRDYPKQATHAANFASSSDSTSRAAFSKPED